PTVEGERFTRQLARELAEVGVAIFSGGARGIDTAAHLGALEGSGQTVVVAPSSFDCPFPPENHALFERVVHAGGAFITSYPPGTQARQHHFFHRNAQLAALALAVVVVETRFVGGARNALAAARKLGRPVLAVPGAPWVPEASGCILEIRNGARIVASADDVLEAIGLPRRKHRGASAALAPLAASSPGGSRPPASSGGLAAGRSPPTPLDPERDRVLAALRKGPAHPDALCAETGLPAARLQALLLTLTLEGTLVSEPSGRVSLVNY
ncbi:MAG TPA: DNA-processing protein DprA, partial [Polyangiaceae bacterium]